MLTAALVAGCSYRPLSLDPIPLELVCGPELKHTAACRAIEAKAAYPGQSGVLAGAYLEVSGAPSGPKTSIAKANLRSFEYELSWPVKITLVVDNEKIGQISLLVSRRWLSLGESAGLAAITLEREMLEEMAQEIYRRAADWVALNAANWQLFSKARPAKQVKP